MDEGSLFAMAVEPHLLGSFPMVLDPTNLTVAAGGFRSLLARIKDLAGYAYF